jgi:hypothetical protein
LTNTLEKIESLNSIPLPIDERQNEPLQSGITAILESLKIDLDLLYESLQMREMPDQPEERFWKTALHVFQQ